MTDSPLRRELFDRGYVVIPNVIPRDLCARVVDDIWRHTGASPHDPTTWYGPTIPPIGIVEMWHYQSMWDIRQHPALHRVFAEIHGTEKLWVSIDRVGAKPPATESVPGYQHRGFIHWDCKIINYPDIPFRVQSVLALEDTTKDMGGFQCVPEIYADLPVFLTTQTPEQLRESAPDFDHEITRVPLNAGDLVVWHRLMPHGNGHNTSDRMRLCQYVTMNPADPEDVAELEERVDGWLRNRSGSWARGDPRGIEERREEPAQLTELGRRLLGLETWEA
ncbi:hypothetical protein BC938DRAFT_472365 [Jimgerdemannia flammicorona]|uniref:Phytanoyl-CoA dioxygenase n=1 Tax=Jimgerdemannia flammicorona TaxID=994334 RepID=A0A433Q684_9FUNG|nr:hypothetical protein BC938DRAFT_472365 [Jimgerdemannia flammicorona]